MRSMAVAILSALAVLVGCGDQQPDRATGGAATGAGTGAVIGMIGGPVGVGVGALIGGAVGATTGAAVSPRDLKLPPPIWSDRSDQASLGLASPDQVSPGQVSSGLASPDRASAQPARP